MLYIYIDTRHYTHFHGMRPYGEHMYRLLIHKYEHMYMIYAAKHRCIPSYTYILYIICCMHININSNNNNNIHIAMRLGKKSNRKVRKNYIIYLIYIRSTQKIICSIDLKWNVHLYTSINLYICI